MDRQAGIAALAIDGPCHGDRVPEPLPAAEYQAMGARFGIPLAAALGDRLRCVVLGKFGLRQGAALHRGLEAPERIAADARRVTAPALFHLQWHDEVWSWSATPVPTPRRSPSP
ncbi:hypothetical protein [Streptomyces paradoxus]|uniref:hypothetical protein n=1 Tax=Streptomyces paradoxus TaxID=66375 RepID=UPI0037D54B24